MAENDTWTLRLAANRLGMEDNSNTSGILKISDDQSNIKLLPVNMSSSDYTGLWVGTAVIDQVSQPSNPDIPNTPQNTVSDAQFRIIVHVDDLGQANLLQQVTLMWKDGTETTPGESVLITRDSITANYSGSTLRDGEEFSRRISSVAFPGMGGDHLWALTGTFGTAGATLTGNIDTAYDHALNPFKHKYYPDHDNKDYRFENQLTTGKESFDIGRAISLEFDADPPEGYTSAAFKRV